MCLVYMEWWSTSHRCRGPQHGSGTWIASPKPNHLDPTHNHRRLTSDPVFSWSFSSRKLVQDGSFGPEKLSEKTVKVPRGEEDYFRCDKHIDQIISDPPATHENAHFENAFFDEDAFNSPSSPEQCTASSPQDSSTMSWSQIFGLEVPPPGTPITSLSTNKGPDSLPPLPDSPTILVMDNLESAAPHVFEDTLAKTLSLNPFDPELEPLTPLEDHHSRSVSNPIELRSLPPLPDSPAISLSDELKPTAALFLEDVPVLSRLHSPELGSPQQINSPQIKSLSNIAEVDLLPPLPDSPFIPISDHLRPDPSGLILEDSPIMEFSKTQESDASPPMTTSHKLELEPNSSLEEFPIISMPNNKEHDVPSPPPLESFPPPWEIRLEPFEMPLPPFENYPQSESDVSADENPGITRYYPEGDLFERNEDSDDGSYDGGIEMDGGSEILGFLPPPPPPPGPGPGPGPSFNFRERSPSQAASRKTDSFDRIWARIKALRAEVWDKRSKIQSLRKVLRQKQIAKSTADDSYIQYIRKRSLGLNFRNSDSSQEDVTLLGLYKESERLRDEYGPMEDDCYMLEDELGIQEFELQRLEERFYERPIEPIGVAEPAPLFLEPRELISEYSSVSSMDSENEAEDPYHPLVSEYLEKVGDVNILRERLEWNLEEKYRLEEEKETRARVNMELQEPDQQWLDDYPHLESDLLNQLDQEIGKADALRHQCFDMGLVDEDGDPTDFEAQTHHAFTHPEDHVDPGSEISSYIKHKELLPLPWSKEVQLCNAGYLPPQITRISEDDLINPWLLHQMRMSPLQIHLLASICDMVFESMRMSINSKQETSWEINVLAFWFRDGSDEKPNDPDASTGVITQAPQTGADQAAISLSAQGENRSFGLALRSSLLSPLSKADPVIQKMNTSNGELLNAPSSERVLRSF